MALNLDTIYLHTLCEYVRIRVLPRLESDSTSTVEIFCIRIGFQMFACMQIYRCLIRFREGEVWELKSRVRSPCISNLTIEFVTAYNSIYTISKHHLPGKHGLVADPKDDFNCEKPAMETERFYCIVCGCGCNEHWWRWYLKRHNAVAFGVWHESRWLLDQVKGLNDKIRCDKRWTHNFSHQINKAIGLKCQAYNLIRTYSFHWQIL